MTLAQWLHLPLLAWLADTTIWPPAPSGTLAPPGRAVGEHRFPQTKRVLTQEEQQQVKAIAQAQEEHQRKAVQQVSTAAKRPTAAVRKPRKPRASTRPTQEPPLPPADSLWGQIDWSTLSETHPLKVAVREELARRETQLPEEGRHRWLAERPAGRPHLASSPQIIGATPTCPPPLSTPSSEKDVPDYNWDEGEGPVQA